ncbi:MAG: alkaline phosphatase [Shewanella sp.]|nr:alkaline phosphatase [Shewanella sp.]MCF1430712.1 alkaline phosphatase [Shewanella sp.]MCF1437807.1 alkaline phosphatase [Shewanella sp.]MCF1458233.1 alkaline phosphatase [Shewanella sp.]
MYFSPRAGQLAGLLALLLSTTQLQAEGLPQVPSTPKNLIIMVGDGMGPAYTSAYRLYMDDPATEEVEETVFNRLLIGSASTFPARESGYVTDSAAAATALSCGIKTYNGAIAVDSQKQSVPTLLERAKQAGLSTGVAVTSQVNHATPAAFLSHNESRQNYDELAQSYLATDAEVILGGGQRYFPESLRDKFRAKGYQVLTQMDALEQVSSPDVLGLFADIHLPWVQDEPEADRLATLTRKSLELLSQNDKGFVLLVEGSMIDWAGHANDIGAAMGEMHGFANAVEVAEQFVRQHPDTLMVATADHSTGGLTIGANNEYRWDPAPVRSMTATAEKIAKQAIAADQWRDQVNAGLGFTPTKHEWQQLEQARMLGQDAMTNVLRAVVNSHSNTGWTTAGHTGVDVQVFAVGAGSGLFSGHQDNTDIANKLASLLPAPTPAKQQ